MMYRTAGRGRMIRIDQRYTRPARTVSFASVKFISRLPKTSTTTSVASVMILKMSGKVAEATRAGWCPRPARG